MTAQADVFRNALNSMLGDRPVAYHPNLARIGGGVAAGVRLDNLTV